MPEITFKTARLILKIAKLSHTNKITKAKVRQVKDKGGKPIPDEEGQKKVWMEHFEELLNRPAPKDPPDIPPASDDLPVDCDPPIKEEIYQSIEQLKNGKSAGPDSIPAEALRTDTETSVELLYPLFNKIWEEEQVPSEWKEGYLIKTPKKGDLSSCSNHRGKTLLSIPGKVFSRVLLNRMKDAVDLQLWNHRPAFSETGPAQTRLQHCASILEQSSEWDSLLYVSFTDCEKDFVSLDR